MGKKPHSFFYAVHFNNKKFSNTYYKSDHHRLIYLLSWYINHLTIKEIGELT